MRMGKKDQAMLNSPAFKKGGSIHKSMKSLYEALHSHFANEAPMKKLHVNQEELYKGEPHREPKRTCRAMGGALATIRPNMAPQKPKKFVSMLNRGTNKKFQF